MTTATTMTARAALCAIQKDGLYYIDKWVDYHLALGFDTIYIYDNSDDFELQQWQQRRNRDQVVVQHFPGSKQQRPAYIDCAKQEQQHIQQQYQNNNIDRDNSWLGFLDIDEFIVLKQHDSIQELLHDQMEFAKQKLNAIDNTISTTRTSTSPTQQAPQQQPFINPVGLTLNRYTFWFTGKNETTIHDTYKPLPVTQRFQFQQMNPD